MNFSKSVVLIVLAVSFGLFASFDVSAQRRSRPGSMKHSERETKDYYYGSKVSAKYISDGHTFKGTAGEGPYKIGDVTIKFSGGRWHMNFAGQEFKTREALSKQERQRRGITDYQYENSWKSENLAGDFSSSGLYKVINKEGRYYLYLYDGDTDKEVFGKATLSGLNDQDFEFETLGFPFKLKLVK
ncbi:MAG: hypothetical protein NC328_07460 [Muribaculum sp.]|nr:hypothetical protein [Muribaculum sp.]